MTRIVLAIIMLGGLASMGAGAGDTDFGALLNGGGLLAFAGVTYKVQRDMREQLDRKHQEAMAEIRGLRLELARILGARVGEGFHKPTNVSDADAPVQGQAAAFRRRP